MKWLINIISAGSYYGKLILLTGLLVAVPLVVLPFYPIELRYGPAFLYPAIFSLVLGFAICAKTYRRQESTSEWQNPMLKGSLPVLFVWCYSFLVGAIPFVIGGSLSFSHALFESISGWTTTGLTIVEDVAAMPRIFLFHRSFMQYCGGLGFILMMVMVIQGKQSMNLYSAEGHLDRIAPNLKRTARIIFRLYSRFLVFGALLYRFFGMELFDAVCHTMSALSTAGFTTQAGSIGSYGSLPIELITVVLMLVGASNFSVLLLLTEGKVRQVLRFTELRFLLGLLAIFVPLSALSLMVDRGMGIGEGLRNALFGVVTTFSTTGYATMDYAGWPPFALGLLLLLMIIGGSAGSTAGGIKLSRTYFLVRITYDTIRKRLSPNQSVTSPSYTAVQGQMPIDASLVADTFGFIVCYMATFIAGTLLLTLTADCPLFDAMFEFASALGTVGISNGLTNAGTNVPTLIVEMSGMVLGRLEVLVVFVGISSCFQALKSKLRRAG